ncbi:hypothetical protein EW146_g5916 [Bondarzewia mesenterica]|uniref:Uncharacterized protein n=1 Tax=Bondarzewia mesenterica TaxID=1095465 RepID=A0A4S4LS49_9AGAM|nr:hypothetical protein EW146_g5916 [Bondarzewia mesenterica]
MFSTPQTPQVSTSISEFSSFSLDVKPNIAELEAAGASRSSIIQAKLNRRLGPEYVSQRPAPGGGPKLTYVEGWKIIGLANEVFGYNGWSSSIVSVDTDYCDMCPETKRFNVGISAVIKVTLRDGTSHEDVGYGTADNLKSKGAALDKAKKEAVTDGMKRALRNFGNLLGLCLYEKSFAQEVVKIKAPPPIFDKSDLHRRPDYENPVPSSSTSNYSNAIAGSSSSATNVNTSRPPAEDVKPFSSIPPHVRNAMLPPSGDKNKAPQTPMQRQGVQNSTHITGLNTPGETPPSNMASGRSGQPQQQRPVPVSAPHTRPPQPPPPASRAPPPATVRTVTFAPPPQQAASTLKPTVPRDLRENDPEDSFFTSDDDALFAAIDLAEVNGLSATGATAASATTNNTNAKGTSNEIRSAKSADNNVFANSISVSGAGAGSSGAASNSNSSSTSATSVKAPTPSASMGGFRSPPGVNPAHHSNRSAMPPPPQRFSSSGGSSSSVGVKRPSEAMQPPRRPGQGMGLAQQAAGNVRRAPFSDLEMGAGGDVKRIRRQ